MVAQGGQGPWQPRGSGLLVAVVALSVVALTVHGVIALVLMNGTVRRPPTSGGVVALPTPTTSVPPTAPSRSGTSPVTPAPSVSGAPWTPPAAGGALRLDHSCLVADNPPTQAIFPIADPFGTQLDDLGIGAELQRLYVVDDRTITPADGAGPVRECDKQLWSVVAATLPASVRPYLKELVVFDALLVNGTSDLYVGEVVPAGTDASKWRLAVAPNGATDLEVAVTIAHEVGHLLSLSAAQLDTTSQPQCQTIWTGSGCLRDSGHVISFLDDTWSDDEIDGWNDAAAKPDDQRDQAFQDFYDQYASSFVDSYAATDPFEDFAESFGIWCALGPGSPLIPQTVEGDPSNGKAKIEWFEQSSSGVKVAAGPGCQQLRTLTR